MKILVYTPLLFLFFVGSCDKNQADEGSAKLLTGPDGTTIDGSWEVRHVSGGFAGINDDLEAGLIRWEFNSESMELKVENMETTESLYDGLPSGTYHFAILDQGKQAYMFIDGQELGNISISGRELTLDGNKRSEGSGADLFILTLVR